MPRPQTASLPQPLLLRLALLTLLVALISLPLSAGLLPTEPASQLVSLEQLARQELEKAMLHPPTEGRDPRSDLHAGPELLPGSRCLPSCVVDDGRFLAVASGSSLVTLSESSLEIQIAVPSGATGFTVGVFDGDANSANGNWDVGTAEFHYTVFTDPNLDGTGGVAVAGPFSSSLHMLNDGWFDIALPVHASTQAPSGAYFYRLAVVSQQPAETVLNAFKVRTDGVATVEVRQQPFGFYAAIQSLDDANTVFPDFPFYDPEALPGEPGHSNYDGEFNFYIDVAIAQQEVVVWGGDLDYGSYDGFTVDEDDLDTPNACPDLLNPLACAGAPAGSFLPAWATADAVPEGVASGVVGSTGNPPDDVDPTGLGIYLQRSPSIQFELVDPEGTVYLNDNPSGNQEWEQFRIALGPHDPNTMDHAATSLPPGQWVVRARGVDMQNLNFWHFFYPVMCSETDGSPCNRVGELLIGDTVFFDDDGSGVQDAGEAGVPGVIVELLNTAGEKIRETTTDGAGHYEFDVSPAELSVRVSALNFLPGGALAGYASTTGDELTDTVVDANILTYDFGYRGTGAIGNFVWYDANQDGIDNEGPGSGIGGVTLTLVEAGPDGAFDTADDVSYGSRITDGGGAYDFTSLPPGLYRVDVDDSTVPLNFVLTTANDPLVVALSPGEDYDDADFGYYAEITDCGLCDGKITELTMRYLGAADGVLVEVQASRGGGLIFSGLLDSGDIFWFVGAGNHGTMGPEIIIFVDGSEHVEIHTSCSVPIGPGTVAGDFEVLAGRSRNGGPLCPLGGGGETGPDDGSPQKPSGERGRRAGV